MSFVAPDPITHLKRSFPFQPKHRLCSAIYHSKKNSSQSAPRTLISLRNHFSEDDRIIIRTPGETEIVGGLLVGGPHIYDISPDSDMLKEHKAG
jgi:hypothetical protein